MAFNPPIDPNDANDPGEMIEAAEHKVDSVSHFVWCMCTGKMTRANSIVRREA